MEFIICVKFFLTISQFLFYYMLLGLVINVMRKKEIKEYVIAVIIVSFSWAVYAYMAFELDKSQKTNNSYEECRQMSKER